MTSSTPWQRLRFACILRLAAAALFARDAVALRFFPHLPEARSRRSAAETRSPLCRQLLVPAGRPLEAQLTLPEQPPKAAVLLCHGIGERLCFWTNVQVLLAQSGIASLVFHYTSYGRSRGPATPESFESSALTAYTHLAGLVPSTPLFLFGTSLGSAVAVQVASSVQPEPAGLILSQGFPSLQSAAAAVFAQFGVRLPVLAHLLPDLWRSTEALATVRCPVLIAHSPADRLFSIAMGEALYRAASARGFSRQALLTPAGFAHNDVCLRPAGAYWSPIIDFILTEASHLTRNADAAIKIPQEPSTTAASAYT